MRHLLSHAQDTVYLITYADLKNESSRLSPGARGRRCSQRRRLLLIRRSLVRAQVGEPKGTRKARYVNRSGLFLWVFTCRGRHRSRWCGCTDGACAPCVKGKGLCQTGQTILIGRPYARSIHKTPVASPPLRRGTQGPPPPILAGREPGTQQRKMRACRFTRLMRCTGDPHESVSSLASMTVGRRWRRSKETRAQSRAGHCRLMARQAGQDRCGGARRRLC